MLTTSDADFFKLMKTDVS